MAQNQISETNDSDEDGIWRVETLKVKLLKKHSHQNLSLSLEIF